MVNFCAVVGCAARAGRESVSFFRIPAVNDRFDVNTQQLQKKRRAAWLCAIRRTDLSEKKCKTSRVCSRHFITEKPSNLLDTDNPDWEPPVNMGYNSQRSTNRLQRYQRAKSRNCEVLAESLNSNTDSELNLIRKVNDSSCIEPDFATNYDLSSDCTVQSSVTVDSHSQTIYCHVHSVEVQTELTGSMLDALEKDLENVNMEKYRLQEVLSKVELTEQSFVGNNEKVKFFTGISDMAVLLLILRNISPFLSFTAVSSLTKFQQLLLTLMKLRLNLKFTDLGYRFHISRHTASRVFHHTLDILDARLTNLIFWPTREQLWKTMPRAYREAFGKSITVVIDCFEITIQRPKNLMARCQTWSDYKQRNTVKYLIGISPQGVVSFISKGWVGRTTDKHLTEHCGILKNLLPGDVVLADRGFNISDEAAAYMVNVKIPAYTKGKDQLHPLEVESTRKIASVRIHVERVIGEVRQRYQMLFGPIPLDMTVNCGSGSTIDKVVKVSCALCNLSPSVIPFS